MSHQSLMSRIRRFLSGRRDDVTRRVDVELPEPPVLDFADLETSFERRTWGFERYEKKLGRKNPRLLRWIGSVDYSGHVREACLRYLVEHYRPGDENRILLRLEDWVLQVRQIAVRWTLENCGALTLAQFGSNHRLILYLSRKARLKDSDVMRHINDCLLQQVDKVSPAEFHAQDSNFRKYLYQIGLHRNSRLRGWALSDRNPFNRLLLVSQVGYDRLSDAETMALKRDRSSLVKSRFIGVGIEKGVVPQVSELSELAIDRCRGVRDLARFCLSKYHGIDAYEIYRSRTDEAFYYIADYANKEDAAFFLDGARSEIGRVRRLCIKAICAVDPGLLRELDLDRCLRESGWVRRLLARHLPHVLSMEELQGFRETLRTSSDGGILIYLAMVYSKSWWHFIDESLSLLMEDSSPACLNYIDTRIRSKAHVYQPAPPDLERRIAAKLNALDDKTSGSLGGMIEEIRFIMRNV